MSKKLGVVCQHTSQRVSLYNKMRACLCFCKYNSRRSVQERAALSLVPLNVAHVVAVYSLSSLGGKSHRHNVARDDCKNRQRGRGTEGGEGEERK